MNEFLIHNVNMRGARFGTPMPRCANCFNITQGAQVTPSLNAAEEQFYADEYSPSFMSDVSSLYPILGRN